MNTLNVVIPTKRVTSKNGNLQFFILKDCIFSSHGCSNGEYRQSKLAVRDENGTLIPIVIKFKDKKVLFKKRESNVRYKTFFTLEIDGIMKKPSITSIIEEYTGMYFDDATGILRMKFFVGEIRGKVGKGYYTEAMFSTVDDGYPVNIRLDAYTLLIEKFDPEGDYLSKELLRIEIL